MLFGWTARSMRAAIVLLPYVAIVVLTLVLVRDRDPARANTSPVAPAMMVSQHMCGVYRAVVTSAMDPLRKSRVQVRVPQANVSGLWALPGVQGASAPAAGAEVWVMFEGGVSDRPVWFGSAPPAS
ncbi:MAG TPA: phage baseplate assembly protein V [Candidatus Eremiobacteraceae bacterium]|nr:phage baseplate assembly protein V [Candidatus Eremiobacteraceae bacterium]